MANNSQTPISSSARSVRSPTHSLQSLATAPAARSSPSPSTTNDGPVITSDPAAVAVSEEGLRTGFPPVNIDTTATGTIIARMWTTITTMTLAAPSADLASGGVRSSVLGGPATLVAAGAARRDHHGDDQRRGPYKVTLTGPIDHPDDSQENILTLASRSCLRRPGDDANVPVDHDRRRQPDGEPGKQHCTVDEDGLPGGTRRRASRGHHCPGDVTRCSNPAPTGRDLQPQR